MKSPHKSEGIHHSVSSWWLYKVLSQCCLCNGFPRLTIHRAENAISLLIFLLNFLLVLCRPHSYGLSLPTVVCIKLSSTHLHIVDNGYLPVNLTGTEVSLPFCSVGTLRTNGQLFLKHFPSFYEIWNHASLLLCVLFSSWRLLLSWCLPWSWCEQRLLETAVLISWSAFCCLCRTAAPGFRELR